MAYGIPYGLGTLLRTRDASKAAFPGEPMQHPADPERERSPDRFQTPDGLEVTLDPATWSQHIQVRHAEVTKDELRQTLVTPQRICAHTSNPYRRIYEGTPRRSGFFKDSFLLVVVALSDERSGRVLTAYLDRRHYQGRQLWP
jgi:hypothetical protein